MISVVGLSTCHCTKTCETPRSPSAAYLFFEAIMLVRSINNIDDLAPLQARWDALAGDCPFRCWTWLATWWKHYGIGRQLNVLLVFDNDNSSCSPHVACRPQSLAAETLVAILPLYVEHGHTQGKVLRLLGDGDVCSEHLDLLCALGELDEVSQVLAEYLRTHADDWDTLKLTALAEGTRNLDSLLVALTLNGCEMNRTAGVNCWSIPLPATWDEFLTMQSKSHRKQLRQLKSRVLESPRATTFEVNDFHEFAAAWEILVDLHQRRRQSLGEPGCFASPQWAGFHREVALKLLSQGHLQLSVLKLNGEPIAAEYHLAGKTAIYAYQGGIAPERCQEEPGQLSMILCIERAILAGCTRFELLRGDEPYKAHWRAEPTPTSDIEVISPRTLARLRYFSWNGLRYAGRLVRQFTNLLS